MFERLLGIILPGFLVNALGFVYAKRAKAAMTRVNRINLNVLAPALIFSALASKEFDLAANRALILARSASSSRRGCWRGPLPNCWTRTCARSSRR